MPLFAHSSVREHVMDEIQPASPRPRLSKNRHLPHSRHRRRQRLEYLLPPVRGAHWPWGEHLRH